MSKLIAVRLPDALHERVKAHTERTGRTITDMVRVGLDLAMRPLGPVVHVDVEATRAPIPIYRMPKAPPGSRLKAKK